MKTNRYIKILSMCLCLVLLIFVGYFPIARGESVSISGDDKIILDKNVSIVDEEKGEYLLTLEAFGTEKSLNIERVGMDIILVLDRSGSMVQSSQWLSLTKDDMVKGSVYYDYNARNSLKKINKVSWDASSSSWKVTYYTGSNFGYTTKPINPITWDGEKWVKEILSETVEYYDSEGNLTETPDKNSTYKIVTSYEYEEVDFTKTKKFYESNMQATDRSLNEFLSIVKAHGEENGVQHKIAVTNYTNNKSNLYEGSTTVGYLNTSGSSTITTAEYKRAFKNVDTEFNTIQKSVDSYTDFIYGSGNTTTHLGLDVAQKIVDNNPLEEGSTRQRMVLVFADGAPGSGTNYYSHWANSSFKYAQGLKDSKVPIYVVGLYNDATSDIDLTRVFKYGSTGDYYPVSNRFFNFVSSNFNVTLKEDTETDKYYSSDNSLDAIDTYEGSTENGYFYGVQNSQDLFNAFEEIAKRVDASAYILDENTVLKDVVTKYFDLSSPLEEGFDVASIKTYTSYFNGESFDERVEVTQEDGIVINCDNREVSVTGFSYCDNYIKQGKEGGKKLIVEIPIKVRDGFWGGNNVPTNDTVSGIYYNSFTVGTFPEPEVNIEVLPEITSGDKTIYYGDDISPEDLNIDVVVDGYQVTIEDNGSMSPYEDWMDDYATLTWTDNSHDLETEIDNKIGGRYIFSVVVDPIEGNTGMENMSENPSNIVGDPIVVGSQLETSISNVYILGYDGLIIEKEISNYDKDAYNDVEFSFNLYVKSIDVYFPELSESEFRLIGEGTEYTLVKADGSKEKRTVEANGIFKLKHNEQAIFEQFKRGSEYYVNEVDIDSATYDIVEVVSSEVTDDGGEIISSNVVTDGDGVVSGNSGIVGSKELIVGVDSLVKFSNECAETNINHLIISKKVKGFNDKSDFTLEVSVGGSRYIGGYKVGSSYEDALLSGEIKTSDGTIVLKQDQVAVILGNVTTDNGSRGIPAGTSFRVEESFSSSENYKEPEFSVENGTSEDIVCENGYNGYASGKIVMGDNAKVVVTNEFLTTSITITKKINRYNDNLEKSTFWYLVEGPQGFEKEVKIEFTEEDSNIGFDTIGKSVVLDNLYPGKYTVKELPTIGYSLVKADDIGSVNPTDSASKIPFSTEVAVTTKPSKEGRAYFWNIYKEAPSYYTINNKIRFDEDGNLKLSNYKNNR